MTDNSLKLFIAYANDAGNWSGTPLVEGNVRVLGECEDRGLLTQLKREKLVETFRSDGQNWLEFTDAGIELAKQHGIDLGWLKTEGR